VNRSTTSPGARNSVLALAAGAAIVSFTGPIVRVLAVPPTVTAFYRMVFGGAILLVIVLGITLIQFYLRRRYSQS